MAIPWIKIETSLPSKPEVMRLAEILDISEFAVVGHLVCFWSWVDENVSPECPSVSGTKRGLDRVAGRDGFTTAMIEVGWLVMEDGRVSIPHLEYHLSSGAKTRAFEQRKKSDQRKRGQTSGKCPDKSGTNEGQNQGPDKRREEKNVATDIKGETEKPEHTGGLSEIAIPQKMQTPECQAAAAMFFGYLDEKGLSDKRPDGAIALQAWWSQMARIGPKDFPVMVERSIAGGHWSVKVLPDPAKDFAGPAKAHKAATSNADWMQALAVCRRYPSGSQQDSEERKIQMTPEQLHAARAVGFGRIAGSTSFDVKQIESEFAHAMKGAKP
jgi:hypothetical protein